MNILSSTQLRNFRLSQLHIDYNDAWIWEDENERGPETYDVKPDSDVFWSDDDSALVKLAIECVAAPDSEGTSRFRRISATGWGILEFGDDVDDSERQDRAYMNGPVMLHGMLRGVIASATGSCVGGPFILPTVNYIEVMRRKLQQLELPDLEDDDSD